MAFSTVSTNDWHSRLGHRGNDILQSLRASHSIDCPECPSFICQSCILHKQIQLRFFSSDSHYIMLFDIIPSNLWTSPVSNPYGYKYYILFLNSYTKFLWTLLVNRKSITSLLIFKNLFSPIWPSY